VVHRGVGDENKPPFDDYLRSIADHFHILSPPGNGIDCHRTWEALYVNRVPVLLRAPHTTMYEDLPVLLVDRWEEITEEFLRGRMTSFLAADYHFEKLAFSCWQRLIRS
jgi:hypothetical protein